jgi:hypothetical protein
MTNRFHFNDLELLWVVAVSASPNDAVLEVKNVVSYKCENNGGQGAVREFTIGYVVQEYV